jgi:hypothetical protein
MFGAQSRGSPNRNKLSMQAFNAKLQAAAKVAAEAVAAGAAGEGGLIEVDVLDDEDLMADDD